MSSRFSPRGREDETVDLPLLNFGRASHRPPMDRQMDIERKNGHIKKRWKRNRSSNELVEALRDKTELEGFNLEDWNLLFPLMHPRKLRLKNIETTLRSYPSSITSDLSLHVGVLLRNKSTSSFQITTLQ
jgi:hypothetical protein